MPKKAKINQSERLPTAIKKLRVLRNLTQLELVDKIKKIGGNVSIATLSNVETGKASPKLTTIKWLAKALNVDYKELLD